MDAKMNDQDARIAEVIEPKPEGKKPNVYWEEGATWSKGGAWYLTRNGGKWQAAPFISAPTWELEGKVWEWLQGPYNQKIEMSTIAIYWERSYPELVPLVAGEFLGLYCVGEIALALLEVLRAKEKRN